MKKYYLAVTDFARPSPLVGSIDTYSGFGRGGKRAIKIHQEIQRKLLKAHASYEAEVSIQHSFAMKGMRFQVSGRMDGIYTEELVTIEEIKTAFDTKKLITMLKDNYLTHPYWLQLQTYGYIFWLKNKKLPTLHLLIASLRNKKTTKLTLDFDIKAYENWLERRLVELTREVKAFNQLQKRRQKEGARLLFPFMTPRPNQKELIEVVLVTMEKRCPMLLQAPTGLGKTTGILYPALKESLSRGQKTIYITPKNSQHQIALDAVSKLQAMGSNFKSLILTSKKKICMKKEPLCNPTLCEFAKDHYTKVTEHQLINKIKKQKNLNALYFKKLATNYQVCPYELQMQSIAEVDVLIGDYNYVFSPASQAQPVAALHFSEQEKTNLVIDEAHNVINRSLDYYSPLLELRYFEHLINVINERPSAINKKITTIVNACVALIGECKKPGFFEPHRIEIPVKRFKQQEDVLNALLNEYLESDAIIESDDPILKLYNYWCDFTSALELVEDSPAFFTSFNTYTEAIKITCCDASEFLQETYNNFAQIIGFSATLKPFPYYSQLMGLPKHTHVQEFASPFPGSRRKLLIIPQLSTKYSDRTRTYAKLIEAITRIVKVKPGNYFVFFPSFDYLEKVFQKFPPLADFVFLKQERSMAGNDVQRLIEKLHLPHVNHLFFAVQGGMFAEGIDYKGNMAIGAFIVGPPLPMYDWEREQIKHYYESRYKSGKEYAYIYPAMAKAIQAAGRVIRSEQDCGLIVLFDNRFLHTDYSKCMPADWFQSRPQELVSKAILKDLQDFWGTLEVTYPPKIKP